MWATIRIAVVAVFALLIFGILLTYFMGAGKELKPSSNWLPQKIVGGPLETRPLPTADKVHEDYKQWLLDSPGAKLRLYDVVVSSPTNQVNFDFRVFWGDSPLGRSRITVGTFTFNDPRGGSYLMEWEEAGKQRPEFIKVRDKPKRFLVRLLDTDNKLVPRLDIVAIEGLERPGVLVAIDEMEIARKAGVGVSGAPNATPSSSQESAK